MPSIPLFICGDELWIKGVPSVGVKKLMNINKSVNLIISYCVQCHGFLYYWSHIKESKLLLLPDQFWVTFTMDIWQPIN